jgi:nitroreductase
MTNEELSLDLLEGIVTTRAMRRYTDEPETDDEIRTCLRAAVQAPSGGNIQPYQYLVVRDPELKAHLGEAPALVLVLMPDIEMTATDNEGEMDVGPIYASVDPAVQNFVLAAPGQGVGTVIITFYRIHEDEVRDLCGIPHRYLVVALLPLGRPRGSFGVAPRARTAEELTSWDRWGERRLPD